MNAVTGSKLKFEACNLFGKQGAISTFSNRLPVDKPNLVDQIIYRVTYVTKGYIAYFDDEFERNLNALNFRYQHLKKYGKYEYNSHTKLKLKMLSIQLSHD